jgi:hypothetical protein
MVESTAKKMHDKAKANLAGRAIEGRSAMASVPANAAFPPDHSETWYKMFPNERPCEFKNEPYHTENCRVCKEK